MCVPGFTGFVASLLARRVDVLGVLDELLCDWWKLDDLEGIMH